MKKLMQLLRANANTERKPVNLVRSDDSSEATLYLYDVIDAWWGIGSEEVAKAISALDPNATLHLRINSPGGDVFEAQAICTAISQHKGRTIAHIDGLAASAATFISAAADEVEISDGAFYMIHNGWTIALGDKRVMKDTALLLEKVDGSIVHAYSKRSSASAEQIVEWMNAETWFTAAEAVEHRFADRIAGSDDQVADMAAKTFNLDAFDKTPRALLEPPKSDPVDVAAWRDHNERRLRLLALNA